VACKWLSVAWFLRYLFLPDY